MIVTLMIIINDIISCEAIKATQAKCHFSSGVARPGPTRACALPSAFQALPSAAQQTHVIP